MLVWKRSHFSCSMRYLILNPKLSTTYIKLNNKQQWKISEQRIGSSSGNSRMTLSIQHGTVIYFFCVYLRCMKLVFTCNPLRSIPPVTYLYVWFCLRLPKIEIHEFMIVVRRDIVCCFVPTKRLLFGNLDFQ